MTEKHLGEKPPYPVVCMGKDKECKEMEKHYRFVILETIKELETWYCREGCEQFGLMKALARKLKVSVGDADE